MDPWMDAAHRGATALAERSHDPVQHREGTNIEDPTSVHRAADAGVNGTGGTLPYFDQIQQSFGASHDLNSVRAHLGSAATQANERMGAQAYATGQNIAFRGQPDLHTAAHEAAHVVQQRTGVRLSGGVGQPGDASDRHADAVAYRVVRGVSAAPLLDIGAGHSAGEAAVQHGAVQRQTSERHGEQASETSAEPGEEGAGQQESWRVTGNLRGNPPVRSEESPPNTDVIEDEAVYMSNDYRLRSSSRPTRRREQTVFSTAKVT